MRNNDRRLRSRHTTASQENRAAWLFLLPSLIGVLLFVLLPFVETIRRSMFDTMGSTWVGFSNYDSVLQNDAFQLAVANTARFLGICLPLLLSGSLILALVLHSRPLRETKAARVFKTTFLLPIAIPVASIVLLWQTLFPARVMQWLVDMAGCAACRLYGDRSGILGLNSDLSVEKLWLHTGSLGDRLRSYPCRSV